MAHESSVDLCLAYESYTDPFLGPLSTFSRFAIEYEKVVYPTAEHAIQCLRMKCLGRTEEYKKLLAKKTPNECRRRGEAVFKKECSAAEQVLWHKKQLDLLSIIFWLRVQQNPKVRETLLTTGDSMLYCMHTDRERGQLEELIHIYMREQIRKIDGLETNKISYYPITATAKENATN